MGALNYVQLLAFFAIAFTALYMSYSLKWGVYSERDISRAIGWLKGHFYWPGPEMIAGDNLPGPFFYFLLFPAFLLGEDTYSQVALWTIIWQALTYTVAFSFTQKITSHKESLLIFLITFLLSRNIHYYSELLNPEFAVMFHVLALIGLYYWREKRNNLYLYLTGLVIALGIQTHLLVALHIITVLLFYIIDKLERKKIKPLLLFLLLALSPFLIYNTLKYFQIFKTSDRYYIDYVSWIFRNIFSETWVKNIKELMFFVVPLSFCYGLTLWHKYKTKKRLLKPSTKNLFIITAIPFLWATVSARQEWYLFFIPFFAIILISKWLDDLIPKKPLKTLRLILVYSFLSVAYILVFNPDGYTAPSDFYKSLFIKNKYLFFSLFALIAIFITSLKWRKNSFYKYTLQSLYIFILIPIITLTAFPKNQRAAIKKSFSTTAWSAYKELHPVMERIYLETSWPPKTAMKKIFNIGTNPEISLLAYYTLTIEKLNNLPPLPPIFYDEIRLSQKERVFEKPQGYFIIQHLKKFINWTDKDWQSYLSQSDLLHPFLKREINEGKTVIQETKLYDSFWLIPYNTTESSLFPEGFHNIGQPYHWEEPEWLKQCSHTQTFQNEQGFFYCRILPGHLQRAGLSIKLSQNSYNKTKQFLIIQFFGAVLSSVLPDVNRDGISLWSDIQIYLNCNKKSFHHFLPDIGIHNWKSFRSTKKMAKALLAPLKLRLPVSDCKKSDIKKIKLTFTEKHTRKEHNKVSIIWKGD